MRLRGLKHSSLRVILLLVRNVLVDDLKKWRKYVTVLGRLQFEVQCDVARVAHDTPWGIWVVGA